MTITLRQLINEYNTTLTAIVSILCNETKIFDKNDSVVDESYELEDNIELHKAIARGFSFLYKDMKNRIRELLAEYE